MATAKISDAQLGMIGAEEARWPSSDVSIWWRKSHEAMAAIRAGVRLVDIAIAQQEGNHDLSDAGRLKAIAQIGLAAIDAGIAGAEVAAADREIDRRVAHVSTAITLPEVSNDIADVMLAAEIRAFIRSQHGSGNDPVNYLYKQKVMADQRVVAAVSAAPAFLSGIDDEQKTQFLARAQLQMFPSSASEQQQLLKAKIALHDAVAAAERMVGQRAQLSSRPGADGGVIWEPRILAKVA
ncbi:hypothetical protein [Mesorhizobium sp. ES1-3]|uniref:hypothetical protein n=1 Tax=Mesorhizobium sp. ES1-3 TaxID=2876628 RepID=UPI001CCEE435|nr:hypothetical protein [Mesorhizobium sp. ES1-3]MBZ9673434.1 hypothetical protein [Mesorhizobium sp. ES1-3]